MSNISRTGYNTLLLEKALLERSINRRQKNIEYLVDEISILYQAKEEKEAEQQFITKDHDWDLASKAFEIWVSTNNADETEDMMVALKRKKAAVAAECSEVTKLLKNMENSVVQASVAVSGLHLS